MCIPIVELFSDVASDSNISYARINLVVRDCYGDFVNKARIYLNMRERVLSYASKTTFVFECEFSLMRLHVCSIILYDRIIIMQILGVSHYVGELIRFIYF